MAGTVLNEPLAELREADLQRLAQVANRLLAGRPLMAAGRRPVRRPGGGAEFLDYRQYVAGDDLRRVDWRVSLRCRQPQVRRHQNEAATDWFICLDRSASMRLPDANKWRLAVQLAAAWAYLLLHLDCRVGLALFSGTVDGRWPLGRGPGQYSQLLQGLRAASPAVAGGASVLGSCADLPDSRAGVLILSDFLAEDGMRAGLARLRGRTVHALQVLSPVELTVPGGVRITLQDVESGQRLSVRTTPAHQALALADLARWQSALSDDCRRWGIPFTVCTADIHWQALMLAHLRQLQPNHA